MATQPITVPRPQRDPARRAAILRAASRVFAQSGFAATSMEDVAGAAGVTKLIVYRHFASKEALYRSVLERVFERQVTLFVENMAAGLEAGGATRALLSVGREYPDGFRLLWRHATREPQFAGYVHQFRDSAVSAARGGCGARGSAASSRSGPRRRCSTTWSTQSSTGSTTATRSRRRVRRARSGGVARRSGRGSSLDLSSSFTRANHARRRPPGTDSNITPAAIAPTAATRSHRIAAPVNGRSWFWFWFWVWFSCSAPTMTPSKRTGHESVHVGSLEPSSQFVRSPQRPRRSRSHR